MSSPNPGSPEAREQGCICPVIDNNRGRYAPWPPDNWVIAAGCPVHALVARIQEGGEVWVIEFEREAA